MAKGKSREADARIMEACGCNRVLDYFAPGPYPPPFSTDPVAATVLWEWLFEAGYDMMISPERGIPKATCWEMELCREGLEPGIMGVGSSWVAALANAADTLAKRTNFDIYKFPALLKGRACS